MTPLPAASSSSSASSLPSPSSSSSSLPLSTPTESPSSSASQTIFSSPPPTSQPPTTLYPSSSPSVTGFDYKTSGFVSIGATDFVLACSPSQLFLRNRSDAVEVGQIIWNAPSPEEDFCQNCNSVMRIVDSLSPATSFGSVSCPVNETCFLADTSYAKLKELVSEDLITRLDGASVMDEDAELLLQCEGTDTTSRVHDNFSVIPTSMRATVPTRCDEFKRVNPDGTCAFSNCFVGPGGSGTGCFFCGATCDNTCGPEDALKNALIPERIPFVFDFGESCCTHDHCYVSSFSKSDCDHAFLRDNLRSCTGTLSSILYFIPLPIFRLPTVRCPMAAFIYYAAVALGGGDAYETAQRRKRDHENKDKCKEDGDEADMYTDPHIRIFDGLSYDCQAIGEFTLSISKAANFEVQGRFSGPDLRGTVTKGIAVRVNGAPLVQLSVPVVSSANVPLVGGYPLLLFVDGNTANLSNGIESPVTDLSITDSQVNLRYQNGIFFNFRTRNSAWFGCSLEFLRYFLPKSVTSLGDIVGLFGTPNQDPFDDWTTRNGEVLEPPLTSTERLFKPAYDYCTAHWCIRNATNSLFTYEDGTVFGNFTLCDAPFGTALDLSSAPADLRALCGNDAACLVYGLTGGITEAENTLRVQAEVDARLANGAFRIEPAAIAADSTVNVFISLDVSESNRTLVQFADSFALFQVDSDSGARTSDLLINLLDDVSGVTSDEVMGDFIFSNVLPIRSAIGGERFSFQAVPVISGVPNSESPLVTTVLNAIRSYSTVSNIGERGTNQSTVSVPSLDGLELLISFTWPMDQPDLDTATSFLEGRVGYSCGSATYMSFSGDYVSSCGEETVVVELDRARIDGVWDDGITIRLFAHWYNGRGVGPATLRMVLRDSDTKTQVSSTRLSRPIDPAISGGGCSTSPVAELVIQVTDRVTMTLFAQ